MKRIFLASLFALALCNANAARIEWDKMHAIDSEVWDTGPLWDLLGSSEDGGAWIAVMIIVAPGASGGLVGSHFLSGHTTVWADQMDKGEIVDYDSMFGRDSSYFYHSTKGSPDVQCDYELIFDESGLAYLGFAVLAYTESSGYIDSYPAYGWVELARDPLDAPVVVSSAWDVDGGAMIVGGGAIPEPTSALLLAVGCAFLALRRKRYVA